MPSLTVREERERGERGREEKEEGRKVNDIFMIAVEAHLLRLGKRHTRHTVVEQQ